MPDPSPPATSKLRSCLQLCRIPNVFTAAADVLMGYLFTHSSLEPWRFSLPLVAASCLLYTAGMVLNDVFDLDIDARERPHRPLPSGRISPRVAGWLGAELMLMGTAAGWITSSLAGEYRTGLAATALAAAVLLYDRWLKRTPLGPLSMGSCRFLNVLLGMSLAAGPWVAPHYLIAAGIGTYIVGVTWFARTEAQTSNRWQLLASTVVMGLGIACLAYYPQMADELPDVSNPARFAPPGRWPYLCGMIGLVIGSRCVRAIANPTPQSVQMAVKS
ncbi:MAG: UbiA family prenyltransferase, partial [Pirellulales bacterium]